MGTGFLDSLSTHLHSYYCAITKSGKPSLNRHFSKNQPSSTDIFVRFRAKGTATCGLHKKHFPVIGK